MTGEWTVMVYQLDKDISRGENYKPVPFMNMDANFFNVSKECIRSNHTITQLNLTQVCQASLILENPQMWILTD